MCTQGCQALRKVTVKGYVYIYVLFSVFIAFVAHIWPALVQMHFCILIHVSTSPPYPTRPVLKTSSPAADTWCPKEKPFIRVPSSKTRWAVWAWTGVKQKECRQMLQQKTSPRSDALERAEATLKMVSSESTEPLGLHAEAAGHCGLCCECWDTQICSSVQCVLVCVCMCVCVRAGNMWI